MRITKYPQSTLLLEKEKKRILIDPGNFMAAQYSPNDMPGIEAVFLTHRHPDHVDEGFILSLLERKKVPVIANADTKLAYPELVSQIVTDREELELGGFHIQSWELPHVPMVDGSAGPSNTGFIFDRIFFHSGDGIVTKGLQVKAMAIPIAGPDLSLRDAHDCLLKLGVEIAIPIHYSIFSDDKPALATTLLERATPHVEIRVLANSQTTML